MDYFELNIKEIPVFRDLSKDRFVYPLEKTRDGNITLKIGPYYLHSRYDPLKEADTIVNYLLNDKDQIDILVLFGNGLGYVARKLFEEFIQNNSKAAKPYLIYIEKDIDLFFTALHNFDFHHMLHHPQVKFFLDSEKEMIGSFIQSIPSKRIRYYYHRPAFFLNQEYYKSVQNYINYILDRKDMNTATFKRFQKLWTKNFIYNLPRYLQSRSVNELKDCARGYNAVVVAGGPTLDLCFEKIREMSPYSLIICVDTTYKILKKNNINPDIIVSIDPQFWNYKYLENEKINDSIIVTDSSIYPKIFQICEPSLIFTGNSIFPIARYFDQKNRGVLAAGGSVATTAFDVARICGAETIFLTGLDLSFPGRKTHFHGAFFETNFLTFSNYFNSAEQLTCQYLNHVPLQITDSTKGKVYTDNKMMIFKKWFDREIPLTSAKVFQPNLGGVLFEGCQTVELADFPYQKKNIRPEKGFIHTADIQTDIDVERIKLRIEEFLTQIRIIIRLCNPILKKLNQDNSDALNLIEKYQEDLLSDPERKEVLNIISSTAQDIIISIIENYQYDEDENRSLLLKTRTLYQSIVDLSEEYIHIFTKTLKFL